MGVQVRSAFTNLDHHYYHLPTYTRGGVLSVTRALDKIVHGVMVVTGMVMQWPSIEDVTLASGAGGTAGASVLGCRFIEL